MAIAFRLILFILAIALTGCVGPTTPFGAIHDFLPRDTDITDGKNSEKSPLRIRFKPGRQVLHDKNDFVVEIQHSKIMPDVKKVRLYYNGLNVTSQFINQAEIKKSHPDKTLTLTFNDLRLRAEKDNTIKIFYEDDGINYVSDFETPTCHMLGKNRVHTIKGFQPPTEYLIWAQEISQRTRLSPTFLTGIVAQESGFNPKAVSWAKALGLTQITPLAEEQIMNTHSEWPRRDIASLSYVELKSKVLSGEINEETDWRLSPKYSLQGGAAYVEYLRSYWALPENAPLLKQLPGDPELNLSKVILASYNSGPARVKNSIQARGSSWLESGTLKEANKYIKLVFSYCYHFSERSVRDDG